MRPLRLYALRASAIRGTRTFWKGSSAYEATSLSDAWTRVDIRAECVRATGFDRVHCGDGRRPHWPSGTGRDGQVDVRAEWRGAHDDLERRGRLFVWRADAR